MGIGAALGVALGFGLGIGTAGLMAGILAVAAAAPAAGRDAQGTAAETGRRGDVLKMLKENLRGKVVKIFNGKSIERCIFCLKKRDMRFR